MAMKPDEDVKLLADDELLSAAKTLAGEERLLSAKLLRHLHEIEKRLLFAKLGYSSLFAYVTEELGYCAASAQARIASMRLMAAIPSIEDKIVTGSVSLTNLAQAQRFFNQERKEHKNLFTVAEKKQVIEKLEGKSTRDAEKELMALSSSPEQFCRPDQVRPVTPTLSEVRFTADQHLLDQLDQIRGLLAHQDANLTLAELIAKMAAITLEKLRAARFAALKKKPEKSEAVRKDVNGNPSVEPCLAKISGTTIESSAPTKVEKSSQSKQQTARTNSAFTSGAKTELKNQAQSQWNVSTRNSRYIPRPVKRAVFQRDRNQCCYIDPITKRRCNSTFALELDHKIPWAKGGLSTCENLETKCATHNTWAAINEFGQNKMRRYRIGESAGSINLKESCLYNLFLSTFSSDTSSQRMIAEIHEIRNFAEMQPKIQRGIEAFAHTL